MKTLLLLLGIFPFVNSSADAASIRDPKGLEKSLTELSKSIEGRVGFCAKGNSGEAVCVNRADKFSLQSVMKLVVAAAALDSVDQKMLALDDVIVLRKENMSLAMQPPTKMIINKEGEYKSTVAELIHRSVTESDSTAVDNLIEKLGGVAKVQDFLKRKGIQGLRVDRMEKDLQTETIGLSWRPEYVDSDLLEKAKEAVPDAKRKKAFFTYMRDERDTSSPQAMLDFLQALSSGKLLSDKMSQHLIGVMKETATGLDRLAAGTPKGWSLGHKTGTSYTRYGISAATNDVGILFTPKGEPISVVAFVADSKGSDKERAAIIAEFARRVASAVDEGK